ncbi:MAG: PilZ domain-containing protein [Deltaproteobacteria bacterium]|nr:PilZ domain-containing protein [Deltaproteobacteria bacterium]
MPSLLPVIESDWETGAAFLEHVTHGEGPASFFHPVAGELPAGAGPGGVVSVVLRFRDRAAEFHVHARVLERVEAGATRGLRLEFLESERGRQELVLACAAGESVHYRRRRTTRIPCRLPVRVRLPGAFLEDAETTDVGQGGLHLVGCRLAPPDSPLDLWIGFPGEPQPFAVRGRVVAAVPAGPQQGMSVEFRFASPGQRAALAALVAKLGG